MSLKISSYNPQRFLGDYSWILSNDEQRLIRKAARDFSTKELAPNARDWEESHTFSRAVFDKMGRLDFAGLYVPEQYGVQE